MARRKLGEILIKAGVVEPKDVTAALREQLRWGGPLGRIMIDMKLITEDLLVKALSRQLEVEAVDLDKWDISQQLIELIPAELAERHMLLAFDAGTGTLSVAMNDPTQQGVIDEIRIRTQMEVRPYIAGPKALERALAKYYARGAGMLDLTLGKAGAALLDSGAETGDDLSDASGFIVPDEKKQKDTEEQRARRDSEVRASVVPGPQPLPVSRPAAAPPPVPGSAARARPPSSPAPSTPSSPAPSTPSSPAPSTPSSPFRTGLSAASQASGEMPIVESPKPPEVEDLKMMLRLLREELRATQRRVSMLESLLNRDEDVLRKLLSLLIEKRVATREEILVRIK